MQISSAGTEGLSQPVAFPPSGIVPSGVSQLRFSLITGADFEGDASMAVGAAPSYKRVPPPGGGEAFGSSVSDADGALGWLEQPATRIIVAIMMSVFIFLVCFQSWQINKFQFVFSRCSQVQSLSPAQMFACELTKGFLGSWSSLENDLYSRACAIGTFLKPLLYFCWESRSGLRLRDSICRML